MENPKLLMCWVKDTRDPFDYTKTLYVFYSGRWIRYSFLPAWMKKSDPVMSDRRVSKGYATMCHLVRNGYQIVDEKERFNVARNYL